jgi:ATP-binding cassette subfamily B protein
LGVVAAANLVAMLGLAIAVDPFGSVVMFVSVVILGVILRPFRSAVKRRARAANRATMELGATVNETSQLGMELHVFHVQEQAEARLAARIDVARDRQRRLQFANSSMSTVYSALAYVALLAALAVVAQSNAASLTSLGAVMLVMLRSLSYGQALQGAYVGVVSSSPAVEELLDRLGELDAGIRRDGGEPVTSLGMIEGEGVTFRYPGGGDVIRDVSFRFEPGEVIGIVGPSGGGKSTLVQLLLGLRDPQRGEIRAAGRPIGSFARREWARKVTFVPQVPHLITGTVADNIRFLRSNVSDEDVERAARLAHLHADIEKFDDGYERLIGGKGGGDLSGGQQQRLCIARALIEHPELLILDEPTSALDVRSEHLIRETLSGLRGRITVVVIAHRLSTLDICDRIMVIQDGEIVGFDAPLRLAETNPFYRDALHLSGLR